MAARPPYLQPQRLAARRFGQFTRRFATAIALALALGACATAYVKSRPSFTVTIENQAFQQANVGVYAGSQLVKRVRVGGVTGRETLTLRVTSRPVRFEVRLLATGPIWRSDELVAVEGDELVLRVRQQLHFSTMFRR